MAAIVGVTLSNYSKLDGAAILADGENVVSEVITGIPGSSVASAFTAADSISICRVVVTGAPVWVKVGLAPVAEVGGNFLVLEGAVEYFAINIGDKIAIFEEGA